MSAIFSLDLLYKLTLDYKNSGQIWLKVVAFQLPNRQIHQIWLKAAYWHSWNWDELPQYKSTKFGCMTCLINKSTSFNYMIGISYELCYNYVYSFASIRRELFGVTALIKSITTNWPWNQCCSIHWWSMVLWWMKCCWWCLVILNPTQDPVSTYTALLALASPCTSWHTRLSPYIFSIWTTTEWREL